MHPLSLKTNRRFSFHVTLSRDSHVTGFVLKEGEKRLVSRSFSDVSMFNGNGSLLSIHSAPQATTPSNIRSRKQSPSSAEEIQKKNRRKDQDIKAMAQEKV